MKCSYSSMNHRCENEGTQTIWCPTWVSSDQGPLNFCDEHSQIFINSSKGAFFFGEDATKEFDSVVKFIKRNDPRYESVKGMLMNGLHVSGGLGGMFSPGVFVVDGECWLLTFELAIHLGKYDDVGQRYAEKRYGLDLNKFVA